MNKIDYKMMFGDKNNHGLFEGKEAFFGGPYLFNKAVPDETIEDIHNMIYDNDISFEKGATGPNENKDESYSNNRDIAYVYPDDYSKWLFTYLSGAVQTANDSQYHFDIEFVTDPIHYVIYPEPNTIGETGELREEGGFLDWHMDIGFQQVNRRKLACIVQLSDPSEYEGGQLQIWPGGSGETDIVKLDLQKGDVLVFPTFLLHRLSPVTKGERRALVYWAGSNRPFR